MSRRFRFVDSRGFTLVELLIVVMMLGIVTLAMYGLYETTQRTATTQDQTVEIQQNLRVAIDQIARDIRMAGFMIPADLTPIATAGQNGITFNTASSFGRAARIDDDFQIPDPVASADEIQFEVASGDQANLFAIGNKVRVIRPPNQNDLFPTHDLEVAGVSSPSATPPWIEIKGFAVSDANVQIRSGDIIVRIADGSNNPNTVRYFREHDDPDEKDTWKSLLKRRTDEGTADADTQDVAGGLRHSANANLDGLQFRYILDDGTEQTTVTGPTLDSIKAVRVTLTGEVNTQQGLKTRSLTSIIALRNR